MIIPFDKRTFSSDVKTMFSGANITLEFDNIQSTFAKVAVDMTKLLGKDLYEAICNGTAAEGEDADNVSAILLSELKRAMLHYAIYHHVIYFIARISNDGITVRKDDNMTTIYRYQQQDLQEHLLDDGCFWTDSLYEYLNDNAISVPLWASSPAHDDHLQTPVTAHDLSIHVGIDSPSFYSQIRWIIREVWSDLISSIGITSPSYNGVRAVCYEAVSRSCARLPYYSLPAFIRSQVDNEQTKMSDSSEYVRTTLCDLYHSKAEAYMQQVRNEALTSSATQHTSGEAYKPITARRPGNDKFCF